MHINSFYIIADKLITFIEENNLPQLYKNLSDSFNSAASSPQGNHQPNIRKQIDVINSTQLKLENIIFSKDQIVILNSFNKEYILGQKANLKLQEYLTQQLGNYSQMRIVADEYIRKINSLINTLKILKENIQPFLNQKIINIDDDNDTVTLIFKNQASVENFEDLQERIKHWKLITQWMKPVIDHSEFEIVSFEDGSCKITIKNIRNGIIALGSLVAFSLNSYNTYLDIQLKEIELAKIKAKANQEMAQEAEPKTYISSSSYDTLSDQIAKLFLNEQGIEPDSENYQELLTNITQASKYLLRFIDDGGEMNFTEKGCQNQQIVQIQNYFVKINSNRLLDGKPIKLLPQESEQHE